MVTSNMDREAVIEAVSEGVRAALETHHLCRYSILPEDANHIAGMIKYIGGGNFAAGVEILRVNHKFLLRFRAGIDSVSAYITKAIITIIIGALATLLWIGLKTKGI